MVLLSDSARNFMFWAEKGPAREHKSAGDELTEMLAALHSLLSIVGHVQSRSQLEDLLPILAQRTNSLARQYADLITEYSPASGSMVTEAARSLRRDVRQAKRVGDMLGEESSERFTGYVESLRGYFEWVDSRMVRALRGDATAFTQPPDLSEDASRRLGWTLFIHGAVMRILTGSATGWTVDALRILIEAADDYMSVVENEFLMARPAPPCQRR